MNIRFDNMDSDLSAFFPRELESIRAVVLEVQYGALKAAMWVPMKTDIDPGAEVYTYRATDMVGVAELASDLSEDGPTVDVKGSEVTSAIRSMKSKYAYTIQEARNSKMANKGLDIRKATAARRAIAQTTDKVMLIGDGTAAYLGLRGLFKLTGTDTYTVPNGAGGSKLWSLKTPDEMVLDMHRMVHQVPESTNEVEEVDTMLLPTTMYRDASSRKMGPNTDTTVLQHFMNTMKAEGKPDFTVGASPRLNTASGTSGFRAVAYKRDPDKLEGILPVAFEQFAPQFNGYRVTTHCHGRIGGVIVYFPKSVIYGDFS